MSQLHLLGSPDRLTADRVHRVLFSGGDGFGLARTEQHKQLGLDRLMVGMILRSPDQEYILVQPWDFDKSAPCEHCGEFTGAEHWEIAGDDDLWCFEAALDEGILRYIGYMSARLPAKRHSRDLDKEAQAARAAVDANTREINRLMGWVDGPPPASTTPKKYDLPDRGNWYQACLARIDERLLQGRLAKLPPSTSADRPKCTCCEWGHDEP